jgi:putative DNA primase/helicase
MSEIGDRCVGRWPDILMHIGIESRFLRNRHGPCPMCGGKDRFRFDNKEGRGTFFCSQCGAGDGLNLVMLAKRVEFPDAVKLVEPLVGTARRTAPRAPARTSVNELRRMWRDSWPVKGDNTAGRYLMRRCKIDRFPKALRHIDTLRYWGGDDPCYFPGMLACVTAPDGKGTQLYRTYLVDPDQKAPVECPRRMMPGEVARGSAVRLAELAGSTLGIAEGIETALSAGVLHQLPVWAAIGTKGMENWWPPAGIERVVIFADRDENHAGQVAAHTLAHRLILKGIGATVEVPPLGDWNDYHQSLPAKVA